jgi:hypothetical protein
MSVDPRHTISPPDYHVDCTMCVCCPAATLSEAAQGAGDALTHELEMPPSVRLYLNIRSHAVSVSILQ